MNRMRVSLFLFFYQLKKFISISWVGNREKDDFDMSGKESKSLNLLDIMLSKDFDMFGFVAFEMKQLIKKRFLYFDKLTNVDFFIILVRESLIDKSV